MARRSPGKRVARAAATGGHTGDRPDIILPWPQQGPARQQKLRYLVLAHSRRQQLRLACSLRLLAKGETITRVALETGYSTPSAFVAMFRKALGTTPRRYFAAPR